MKTYSIKIGNRRIGNGAPVFIIAEAGVNHNGKLDLALKLVEAAAEAGADAVKFQTFQAENVVLPDAGLAEYQKKNLGYSESQRDMLRELELKEEFYKPILERCRKKNIIFLSTPHGGRQSVDFLESLGAPAYKVGSGDLTNYLFLKHVARTEKPIILSTGMANLKEVKDAVSFIKRAGNDQIAILHCTTNYPCLPEEVNLMAMATIINEFSVPVGYSDHTIGQQTAIMAITLGAAIYECHITLDKNLPGPDHIASVDPKELKDKISAIRKVALIMGSARKIPNPSELKMKKIIRKSLVFARAMAKGEVIRESDLEAKRPGDGVSPTEFSKFVGKRTARLVRMDQKLFPRDIDT